MVYFGHMLGVNIETDMREELYQHLQNNRLSIMIIKNRKLMSRLTTDLLKFQKWRIMVQKTSLLRL